MKKIFLAASATRHLFTCAMRNTAAALLLTTIWSPTVFGSGNISEVLDEIKIGGALRFNYEYLDFSTSHKEQNGKLDFELFRIKITGELSGIEINMQYRWYDQFEFIEYAYLSSNLTENSKLSFGLTPVPFGNLPYNSNSYWESLFYHLGLEDDNDMGIKYSITGDNSSTHLAFFMKSESSGGDNIRYSFDVVTGRPSATPEVAEHDNVENNQINFHHSQHFGDFAKTGVSLQYGQLYNEVTERHGDHYAAAIHGSFSKNHWNVMYQLGTYEYSPKNPPGVSDESILIGAFTQSSLVASKANFLSINIARDIKVESLNWLDSIRCYNDFGLLEPRSNSRNLATTMQNTLGCSISNGPLTIYGDFISGKNSLFLEGIGNGIENTYNILGNSDEWGSRLNINIGYYF